MNGINEELVKRSVAFFSSSTQRKGWRTKFVRVVIPPLPPSSARRRRMLFTYQVEETVNLFGRVIVKIPCWQKRNDAIEAYEESAPESVERMWKTKREERNKGEAGRDGGNEGWSGQKGWRAEVQYHWLSTQSLGNRKLHLSCLHESELFHHQIMGDLIMVNQSIAQKQPGERPKERRPQTKKKTLH